MPSVCNAPPFTLASWRCMCSHTSTIPTSSRWKITRVTLRTCTNASLLRRLIQGVLQSALSPIHPRIMTKSSELAQHHTHACRHHRPLHRLPVRLCRGRQPHLLRCSRSPTHSFLALCASQSLQGTAHCIRSLRHRRTPHLIRISGRLSLPPLGQRQHFGDVVKSLIPAPCP